MSHGGAVNLSSGNGTVQPTVVMQRRTAVVSDSRHLLLMAGLNGSSVVWRASAVVVVNYCVFYESGECLESLCAVQADIIKLFSAAIIRSCPRSISLIACRKCTVNGGNSRIPSLRT